ncbi:thioredoxin [Spelaeicoccus albus]|uniref:Thioredoxin n=1 Tax=Spelaeicoccus albus TaxID=1280376 RepID=A0A7Z0D1Q8_9MICO|nr:thioredoxin [Spelaeicoccus albus]NYI66580.1 thioredoxin 1 [Spelaeicoccus albus]
MSEKVTDATFDDVVLNSDKPVLVDFWAEWCGPCRQVGPIVDEIGAENADKLKVVKLNTDENPQSSAKYGITSIPAMFVFDKGQHVKSIIGARPKPDLLSQLSDYLS